jgi:hypothetical protein
MLNSSGPNSNFKDAKKRATSLRWSPVRKIYLIEA